VAAANSAFGDRPYVPEQDLLLPPSLRDRLPRITWRSS
jgi:hypothetical protein